MDIFRKSLGAKILGITFVILVLVFSAIFSANYYMQHASTEHEIKVNAERTGELLRMSIREPMSIGDNEGTTEKFEEMGRRYGDIDIYLTNFKANVTYATKTDALRKDFAEVIKHQDLTGMLADRLKTDGESDTITRIDGKPFFVEVITIPNEPSCHPAMGRLRPCSGPWSCVRIFPVKWTALHKIN